MTTELVRIAPTYETSDEEAMRYCGHLADILTNDRPLLDAMGSKEGNPIPAEEVLSYTTSWCREKSALSFAIVAETIAIGLISLSHIDWDNRRCRAGYWLASRHWNQGYTTAAFARLLDIARDHGLRQVHTGHIVGNVASARLWDRQGAVLDPDTGTRTITLY